MSRVVIVPTGTANTASVLAAFSRLGVSVGEAGEPAAVTDSDGVVLPGVGAFGAAMSRVNELGLRSAIAERVAAGRPTLAVRVGMQLLCRDSEESPGASGIRSVDLTVTRFRGDQKVPQLGWNRVEPDAGAVLIEPGWGYFANSYRIDSVPEGWVGAVTDYSGRFVSAIERGAVLATQFHPELSGDWGAGLLARWLDTIRVAA
jgi:imidazole glycerol phosphate synthase glutamine amidotransferase subunit